MSKLVQTVGTAKTTTTAALGVLFARSGIRTHLVDMDPQASLTTAFDESDTEGHLYQAMNRRGALPIVSVDDNLTISPSSIDLSRGETQFIAETGREFILQQCLGRSDLSPDTTVLLDCPPSLGVLAINCLTAASHVCVAIQPGGFELRTLVHLDETVSILRQRTNPQLTVAGAVITNCHIRRSITEAVRTEIAGHYAVLGLIRADARLLYATTSGKVYHLTRSKALDDYRRVATKLKDILPWLARQ